MNDLMYRIYSNAQKDIEKVHLFHDFLDMDSTEICLWFLGIDR